ncbi:MAG TPA: hypothetical protein PKI61_01355 [bacterium]|nr:hypothetical protein [bacterium]HPT29534.1 hypothetical protein [bacterium]
MFDSSRDILNLVLALCITGFTVFVCWSLYYLIATLRSVYRVIKQVEATIQKVSELTKYIQEKIEAGAQMVEGLNEKVNNLFHTLKDRLNNTGSYLMIIGEVLRRIFDFMQTKQEKKYEREEYSEPAAPKTSRTRKK